MSGEMDSGDRQIERWLLSSSIFCMQKTLSSYPIPGLERFLAFGGDVLGVKNSTASAVETKLIVHSLLLSIKQQAGGVALPSSERVLVVHAQIVAEQIVTRLFTGNFTGSWGSNGHPSRAFPLWIRKIRGWLLR